MEGKANINQHINAEEAQMKFMEEERVLLVNEQDNVIGTETKKNGKDNRNSNNYFLIN